MSLETATQLVTDKVSSADQLGNTVKFVFSGGEGVVFVDGTVSPGVVSNDDQDAECSVNLELDDFLAMMSGELDAMNAFMSGKMTVDGDMSVAMKLQTIFG